MVTIARVSRRYITVHVFCKIFKKYPLNARWIRLVSELFSFVFDMQRKWAHKTEIRQERWHIKKAEKL